MLNKVGKIEEGGYHAAKYILYDDETGETLAQEAQLTAEERLSLLIKVS